MRTTIIAMLLVAGMSCKRNLSPAEVQTELKKAMTTHLYQGIKNDSSKARFYVLEVNYFADKDFYECEFKVHMVQKNLDTTGMMTARIAKDFSWVKRKL